MHMNYTYKFCFNKYDQTLMIFILSFSVVETSERHKHERENSSVLIDGPSVGFQIVVIIIRVNEFVHMREKEQQIVVLAIVWPRQVARLAITTAFIDDSIAGEVHADFQRVEAAIGSA